MSLADIFDALRLAGVVVAITEHGSLRLSGNRPDDNLRALVIDARAEVADALGLAARLERGWTLCEQAAPADRDGLEAHWIGLLREYERLMDQPLDAARRAAA